MRWRVRPSTVNGEIMVPGDKSISHRALMVGAIAPGRSVVSNLASGADVAATANCVAALGPSVSRENGRVTIDGGPLGCADKPLDAGNSGTTMRLLSGILAGQPFVSTLTGDESLRRRPMSRIADPLQRMGATVETDNGRAPIVIHGGRLNGITYRLPVASAQVKSCVLLAGLFAEGQTVVEEPVPTRDHTERLLEYAGIEISRSQAQVAVRGGSVPNPFTLLVPGDFSSAAFLLAAGAIAGGVVTVKGVGVNPTRVGFLDILRRMGCTVKVACQSGVEPEPVATMTVESGDMRGTEVEPAEVPNCVDELPLVALLATLAEGRTIVSGAADLRAKETDRIAAIVSELNALGASVKELPDGFEVYGRRLLHGGHCTSHGDHRIAMMLALAGLVAEGETIIDGVEVAAISYPGFAGVLQGLGAEIDEA